MHTHHNTPLILTVAPNGAYKTHAQHPAVPLTAQALDETARSCLDAGAAMIHMHVRRPDGRHLLEADAYKEATSAIRQAVGQSLVIQITTEAAQVYEPPAGDFRSRPCAAGVSNSSARSSASSALASPT